MLALEARRNMFHSDRHTTPPFAAAQMYYPNSAESSNSFIASAGTSPESVHTDITAPSRGASPVFNTTVYRGPILLPKIRCQDQLTEPAAGPVRNHRTRTVSAGPAVHRYTPYSFGIQKSNAQRPRTRSPESRAAASSAFRSASPSSALAATSTLSGISYPPAFANTQFVDFDPGYAVQSFGEPGDAGLNGGLETSFRGGLDSPILFSNQSPPQACTAPASRRTSLVQADVSLLPAAPKGSHSRSASASSVDQDTVWRHGYPTQYRNMPLYVTAATQSAYPTVTAPPVLATQSAGPAFMTNELPLSFDDADFSFTFPQETTTLMEYLNAPNPAPGLISRSVNGDFHRKTRDWWWWDVRSLRDWSDFNLSTILDTPDFSRLLHFPRDAAQLSQPARSTPPAETEHHLRDIYTRFFGAKVNASLKASLGASHLAIHAQNSATTTPWPKPDFVATYPSDFLRTFHDSPRGRVVGLVKPYDLFNSAMRSADQPRKVQYLHALSHLHRCMREHRCRYGFIITEIELICVRLAVADPDPSRPPHTTRAPTAAETEEGPIPLFGALDLAKPIPLSQAAAHPLTGAPQLTAGLALWFLHMLAKGEPLAGQAGWKVHVGGPAERTRAVFGERDAWMPKVQDAERRAARCVRGWVWPEEPFHKKENLRRTGRR